MPQMMAHFALDPSRVAAAHPRLVRILRQRCAECPQPARCRDTLDHGQAVREAARDFCPNAPVFDVLVRRQDGAAGRLAVRAGVPFGGRCPYTWAPSILGCQETPPMAVTFAEVLHKGFAQTFEVTGEMLVDERSDYQHIQIFDTPLNGRVMALDGIVQITDRDEASYSEMLVHVPAMEIGDAKRVFIIGGGDGAVAEEALKYPHMRVDMCEIDGRVVAACKQHLGHVNNGAFDNPRFSLHIQDAFEFLKQPENQGAYDIIVADRPDPVGPAEVLFQTAFYEMVRDALSERGVVVFQNGVPFYQPEELSDTMAQLRTVFPHSGCYLTVTPSYIGGFMAITWGSKGTRLGDVAPAEVTRRWQAAGVATDYYNPAIHFGSMALPEWVRRLMGG